MWSQLFGVSHMKHILGVEQMSKFSTVQKVSGIKN